MGRTAHHFPTPREHAFGVIAIVFVVFTILIFGLVPQFRRWQHQRNQRRRRKAGKVGGNGELDPLVLPFAELEARALKGDVRAQSQLVHLLAHASKERVGKLREKLAQDETKLKRHAKAAATLEFAWRVQTSRQQSAKEEQQLKEHYSELGSRHGSWSFWPSSNIVHPVTSEFGQHEATEWPHHNEHNTNKQPPRWGHNSVHPVVTGTSIDINNTQALRWGHNSVHPVVTGTPIDLANNQPTRWRHNAVHPVVTGTPIDSDSMNSSASFETPVATVEREELARLDRSLAPPASLSGKVWGHTNSVHPEGPEEVELAIPRLDFSQVHIQR